MLYPLKMLLLSCVSSLVSSSAVYLSNRFIGGGGTVWVPLVEYCKSYERIGVVGIGGLGHLAIQFAAKMGCDVVVFSSTEDKKEEAMKLGASEFYATRGVTDYSTLGVTKLVDRLLITSSAKFDLGLFYPVLARNATILPLSVDTGELTAPYLPTVIYGQKIIGSCICSRFPQCVFFPSPFQQILATKYKLMQLSGTKCWNLLHAIRFLASLKSSR